MADFNQQLNDLLNTKDTTQEYDPADIEQNKVMAILSYLWILFLVPMFAAAGSKFAQYHVNQGLTLFIVDTAAAIVAGLLGLIPAIGILFTIIGSIGGLAALCLTVIGIINAANGKAKELPLIGQYTFIK